MKTQPNQPPTQPTKVAVKSITIIIGKREIQLTLEEAKELHLALSRLLGEKVKVVSEIHHHAANPSTPLVWPNPQFIPQWRPDEIICGSGDIVQGSTSGPAVATGNGDHGCASNQGSPGEYLPFISAFRLVN